MNTRNLPFRNAATPLLVAALALGAATAGLFRAQSAENRAMEKRLTVRFGDYRITGPHTHKNLSLFLIRGKDKIKGEKFLTLEEALKQDKVVIHETSNVNRLIIENPSNAEIYIQAGDIVKGGKQDRCISYDIVIPRKSGKKPVDVFCVEQSRWSRRGGEAATRFSASSEQVATKELKLAVRKAASQQAVWRSVAGAQEDLSRNVGGSVQSGQSASSLQLSLEDKKVQKASAKYVKNLSSTIQGEPDVVGYAFAINGEVNSVDVYACNALFKKLWPKLLRASSVEAVAKFDKKKTFKPVTADDIKRFMLEAEKGRARDKDVDSRIRLRIRESGDNIFFETRDEAEGSRWLHRAYY